MSSENPAEFHPEHISESSPEYQENREVVHEHIYFLVFGELELMRIDRLRNDIRNIENQVSVKKNLKTSTESEEREIQEIQKKIDEQIDHLRNKLGKVLKSSTKNITPFLREILGITEIAERVEKDEDLPALTTDYTKELRLGTFILKNKLDNSDLEMIIRRHADIYFKRAEKLNEILPEMFARFRDSALEAIKEKYLPITEELLESRIGGVKVVLGDTLLMKDHQLATHDVFWDRIEISPNNQTMEEVEECIFHELVHALSGRTIIMNNEEDDIVIDIDHQKIGLAFRKVDREGKYVGKQLRWLNEAVTEDITSYLVKRKTHLYEEERLKLGELFNKGLSRDVLYKAYFENYNPALKGKVPAWKEFTRELNSVYPEIGIQELIKMEDDL